MYSLLLNFYKHEALKSPFAFRNHPSRNENIVIIKSPLKNNKQKATINPNLIKFKIENISSKNHSEIF